MQTLSIGNSGQLGAEILNQMHEYRHQVFVERLKWKLPAIEGPERDQYDTADARYVVLRDDSKRITACARLLPTMGRYMLPELFPQLLGEHEAPRDPAIWELSRFATSVRATGEGRVLTLSRPTLRFLDLILDFSWRSQVKRLLFVTTPGIERLLVRAGVNLARVSAPAPVHGHMAVALCMEVDAAGLQYLPDIVAESAQRISQQAQRSLPLVA